MASDSSPALLSGSDGLTIRSTPESGRAPARRSQTAKTIGQTFIDLIESGGDCVRNSEPVFPEQEAQHSRPETAPASPALTQRAAEGRNRWFETQQRSTNIRLNDHSRRGG